MEVSCQLHTTAALPPVPIINVPGESQFSYGRLGQEKYNLPLPEFESRFLGHPSHGLVTIQTALSLLP